MVRYVSDPIEIAEAFRRSCEARTASDGGSSTGPVAGALAITFDVRLLGLRTGSVHHPADGGAKRRETVPLDDL